MKKGIKLTNYLTSEEIAHRHAKKLEGHLKKPLHFREWYAERLEKCGYFFNYRTVLYAYREWKRVNEQEHDSVAVFTGGEGQGKSTLCSQWLSYIDKSMEAEQITTTATEFFTTLNKLKRGQSLQVDEAAITMISRSSMSKENKDMIQTFNIMRKKGISTGICIPDYRLLDSYIRNHRIEHLFIIPKRGKYKHVWGAGIDKINKDMRRVKDISRIQLPGGTFLQASFKKDFPKNIDKEKYDALKDQNIDSFLNKKAEEYEKIEKLPNKTYMTVKELCNMFRVTEDTVYRWIKSKKVRAVKFGKSWKIDRDHIDNITKK
jgi:excisionase family DNA binding protein